MPAFYIFFHKHDQEADQQKPAADPYGALPEIGCKYTAHDGTHCKYADDSIVADTFIPMVLLPVWRYQYRFSVALRRFPIHMVVA